MNKACCICGNVKGYSMSKKDFELIAYLLSVAKVNDTIINLFAITLKQHYPNFDREKFKQACTVVQYRSATMENRL